MSTEERGPNNSVDFSGDSHSSLDKLDSEKVMFIKRKYIEIPPRFAGSL